ncbi:SEC-C metal-binding domain-containing protein [Paraburkholderia sacchari]
MKPASKVRDALAQYSRKVSRQKFGRNDPCHCGSGRKYKKCCLS